jgi:Mg2+ and Co2+ transporter CorA
VTQHPSEFGRRENLEGFSQNPDDKGDMLTTLDRVSDSVLLIMHCLKPKGTVMNWSTKDKEEAARVATWTNSTMEQVLKEWEKQYEYEADVAESYDRMFPSDY